VLNALWRPGSDDLLVFDLAGGWLFFLDHHSYVSFTRF
jgi:hypothetical protein